MAQIEGDIIEIREKEVDDYGRIGVGTKHAGKNLKVILMEPDQDGE